MTVAENIAIEQVRDAGLQRGGFLRFAAIRMRAEAAISIATSVKSTRTDQRQV
jgi:hypothetical protein